LANTSLQPTACAVGLRTEMGFLFTFKLSRLRLTGGGWAFPL